MIRIFGIYDVICVLMLVEIDSDRFLSSNKVDVPHRICGSIFSK